MSAKPDLNPQNTFYLWSVVRGVALRTWCCCLEVVGVSGVGGGVGVGKEVPSSSRVGDGGVASLSSLSSSSRSAWHLHRVPL